MFEKLKNLISKVSGTVKEQVEKIASKKYKLKAKEINELMDNFEMFLLQQDVSLGTVEQIKRYFEEKLKSLEFESKEEIEPKLKELFLDWVCENVKTIEPKFDKKPTIIMFLGPNGSGKTTTIAKIANLLKNKGLKVVLSAADTFRAGAIEQLKEHASRLEIKVIEGKYKQDPASVAFNAIEFAKANDYDVVLIDTAGRQSTSISLMEELRKIKRVAKPDFAVFVIESLLGQSAISQAKEFENIVGFDAVILTKVDLDEKGGTLLSISYELKKPVWFLSFGQDYAALKKPDCPTLKQLFG